MEIRLSLILMLTCHIISGQSVLNYVNPLIGTATATTESALRHGAGTEGKGQTFPGVGRPFGMTQWTPETRTTEVKCVSPYYYGDQYITGFRGSHWMSGSCTQDYGSATLMPFSTERPDTLSVFPVSEYDHDNEFSSPAYYRVILNTYNITAELAASERSAVIRFNFGSEGENLVLIRINSDEKEGKVWYDSESNEIRGYNPVHRIYQGWGKPAGFSGYFVIRPDKPVTITEYLAGSQTLVVSVGKAKTIDFRIGSSFTSLDAAATNLDKEIAEKSIEEVRKEGERVWNETLGKITVKGGSHDDLVKFYTALYHCYQLPRMVSDCDGSYPGFADDTLVRNTGGFVYYDDFSMWDTYRALHPLMIILEPERTLDMVKSLILKAEQGGWMPIFPAWSNYTVAMIGDHVSTMIADAYIKGIRGFDTGSAYRYMRQNAFESPSRGDYVDGKGRRALESYISYGYIPMEDSVWDAFHKNEQVSRTLEYALDDYALSRFAAATGKSEDHAILLQRAANWKNVFDVQSGYVRGRYADGSWTEPFDPYSKAKFICEGTPFHYTWYVPHDAGELMTLMGGKEKYFEKLDVFFKDGHYWHGNEPGHQVPFMYSQAGRLNETTELVARIAEEEYGTGPGGLSGNEDAGQMSAWLVFAMMGFYPVCPASGEYVFSVPIFDEVQIRIPDKKKLILSKKILPGSASEAMKWQINRNGKPALSTTFSHTDLLRGGHIEFINLPE